VRKDHVADMLLSLVGSPARARSVVGDLMEQSDRGHVWFWRSIVRVFVAMLGRDLLASPFAMAASCAVAWFFYMAASLVLAFTAYVLVTLVWGVAYVFAHHTGVELLTDALMMRFDWPPIPGWALYGIQAAVLFAIAPFSIGRGSARFWRGHEVTLAVMTLIVWTVMALFVPLVGIGISARPSMVPVMVMFVLAGALFERRSPATAF